MTKKLCFIVVLSMCLLIVEFAHGQEGSSSPAVSPGRENLADSPLPSPSSSEADFLLPPTSSPGADFLPPPFSSPAADSPQPPVSSLRPEPLADSPLPPPPPPQQPESPSAPSPSRSAPVPAPSDDDSDDDSEPETEYFPSPTPSPAPEVGIPDDIKASEEDTREELDDERGEDNGLSGLEKAGIAIGAILGVGAIVIGALVYKKRRDNMTRARYTYFTQGEFL